MNDAHPIRPPSGACLAGKIADVFFAERLFDALPDVVFFVKDLAGRYLVVNRTLVQRCGVADKQRLLGRTAAEVFPAALAQAYAAQDALVLGGRRDLHAQLELHWYAGRRRGWCLTDKIALRDASGAVVGMAGISRDLAGPNRRDPGYARIAAAARHLQAHYGRPVAMAELVALTGLSLAQLERHFRQIYALTPRQMLIKLRLDAAAALLQDSALSITDIAAACGYQDHSAFSRMFRATAGMTPSQYRARLDSEPAPS